MKTQTPKPQPVPIKIDGGPFSKLSKAAQRVAIAQDIIAQIKTDNYLITTGHWVNINIIDQNQDVPDIDQHILLHGLPPVQRKLECSCCAVGAAFLSSIRLANKAVIEDGVVDSMDEAADQLEKYFSAGQLDLIEEAFELGQGGVQSGNEAALDFGKRYDDEKKRALAIFTNIVKNKGEFKP